MGMKYHQKNSAHPKRETQVHEIYQNLMRTEAEARVVINEIGSELDQIRSDV